MQTELSGSNQRWQGEDVRGEDQVLCLAFLISF